LVPYLCSSSNLQPATVKKIVLHPELTVVVVSRPRLARLTKPKKIENKILVKQLKVKQIKTN
jgi:hypothetical protein